MKISGAALSNQTCKIYVSLTECMSIPNEQRNQQFSMVANEIALTMSNSCYHAKNCHELCMSWTLQFVAWSYMCIVYVMRAPYSKWLWRYGKKRKMKYIL